MFGGQLNASFGIRIKCNESPMQQNPAKYPKLLNIRFFDNMLCRGPSKNKIPALQATKCDL